MLFSPQSSQVIVMRVLLPLLIIAVSIQWSHAEDIAILPTEATVAAGNDIQFVCTIMADMQIVWQKTKAGEDAVVLQDNLDYITIKTTTEDDNSKTVSVLKISDLEIERDTAAYTCQDSEYSRSFSAHLKVYQPPYIRMTTKPEDPIIEVKKAENITIYCATNGRDVEWEKNGVKINGTDLDKDGDNDVLVKENNTLIIVNSEVTDAGVYSCFIEHILDGKSLIEKESVEIQAVVAVELEQSVNLEEGETAHIKCEIQGYPVPSVVWYKESEESGTVELVNGTEKGRVWISVEVKPEMIISTLIIKSVQHEDRALYNCTAANDYTYDSEECMLRVKDRLAALWPFIGILIEVVVLCAIILICEKRQKGKQAQDEDDDELPSKKLNDNSSKEADIRLRNINS